MFNKKQSLGTFAKKMIKAMGGQEMGKPAFESQGYNQGDKNNPQQTTIVYGANSPDQYK